MSGLAQDVHYAARGLRRHRGFAIAVVVTLGIGIGLNTAVFSVLESILLRPLPFRDADRLVEIWSAPKEQPSARIGASGPEFQDFRQQSRTLEQLAMVAPHFTYTCRCHCAA